MKIFKKKNCKCCANKGTASETRAQQKVLCPDDYREGGTLNQSSAVHIQAFHSADVILPDSSSKLRLLVINLA